MVRNNAHTDIPIVLLGVFVLVLIMGTALVPTLNGFGYTMQQQTQKGIYYEVASEKLKYSIEGVKFTPPVEDPYIGFAHGSPGAGADNPSLLI